MGIFYKISFNFWSKIWNTTISMCWLFTFYTRLRIAIQTNYWSWLLFPWIYPRLHEHRSGRAKKARYIFLSQKKEWWRIGSSYSSTKGPTTPGFKILKSLIKSAHLRFFSTYSLVIILRALSDTTRYTTTPPTMVFRSIPPYFLPV